VRVHYTDTEVKAEAVFYRIQVKPDQFSGSLEFWECGRISLSRDGKQFTIAKDLGPEGDMPTVAMQIRWPNISPTLPTSERARSVTWDLR
jgi:hypothetical protein